MKTPLRLAREQRNLTISQVATTIGLDPGNLSRIERGNQTPSKEVAEKLAVFFGYQVSEIQILYPERYTDQVESHGEIPFITPHELRPDLYPNPTDGLPTDHQSTPPGA